MLHILDNGASGCVCCTSSCRPSAAVADSWLTANLTVICAAHPHPGNLQRTPDGQLAILDFGLMSRVDENIKYGMIEAISHLIHRDYEAIVEDFVTLEFIPPGTDLSPILPVLAKVWPHTQAIS